MTNTVVVGQQQLTPEQLAVEKEHISKKIFG